ncbi:MAG: hypothetical protein C4534_06650 [Gaiellales bacterium]|nr:MAG: hypothetical protein C4534_06650 [Gaiellales bacterium]
MRPVSEAGRLAPARVVLAGVCIVIFSTAFELIEPVATVGPVSFTTSELAAGVFLASCLYWWVVARPPLSGRRALDLAVLLFVAGNFLSSVLAEDRPSALKYSLRMTFAALVYFGMSRLPGKKYHSHMVVAAAVAVTVLVVVLVGLVETFIFARYYMNPLSAFQEGVTTFGSFYNLRTTSTLPFPTVLSFYLEITLPVILALTLWLAARARSAPGQRLLYAASLTFMALVFVVQVYTYTRSGLVALPLALAAGLALAFVLRLDRRVRWMLVMALALLPLVTGVLILASNSVAVRFNLAQQEQRYNATYSMARMPSGMAPGQEYTATVRVTNTSRIDWARDGRERVFISYRWVRYPELERGDAVSRPTLLPHDVPVDATTDVEVVFDTPADHGRYLLLFDLFKTHVSWFSDAGVYPLVVPVEIDAAGSRTFELAEEPPLSRIIITEPILESVSRSKLWEAAWLMFKDSPVLGAGSDQFRLRYGEYVPGTRHDERLRTHNIFLEALANNGIVGLATMVYLLGAAAWTQFRLARGNDSGEGFRYFGLALLMSTFVYVLHGLLDVYLWQTGVLFMFFTLLGLTSWLAFEAKGGGAAD